MNDATAYWIAKDFIALPMCALSFWMIRRHGMKGILLSLLLTGALGMVAICTIGAQAKLWNFSAATYRSLNLAWGCAFVCSGLAGFWKRKDAPTGIGDNQLSSARTLGAKRP